jgi:hypothetical protein
MYVHLCLSMEEHESILPHFYRFTSHNLHHDPFMFLLIFSVLAYFSASRFCPFCYVLNVLISDKP